MLVLDCPFCGPRDSDEFSYGGDATVRRPADPGSESDAEWTAYLFLRRNPKGIHLEHWFHRDGCRRWIRVRRDTVTHLVEEVTPAGHAGTEGSE